MDSGDDFQRSSSRHRLTPIVGFIWFLFAFVSHRIGNEGVNWHRSHRSLLFCNEFQRDNRNFNSFQFGSTGSMASPRTGAEERRRRGRGGGAGAWPGERSGLLLHARTHARLVTLRGKQSERASERPRSRTRAFPVSKRGGFAKRESSPKLCYIIAQ